MKSSKEILVVSWSIENVAQMKVIRIDQEYLFKLNLALLNATININPLTNGFVRLNGALGGTRTPDTLVRSQFDQM